MLVSGEKKEKIRQLAIQNGFQFCGFAKAEFLETEARQLEAWLSAGNHGKMSYLENHFEKRTDPRLLVENCKTVISLAINYFPAKEHKQPADAPRISMYAWGEDYHHVIRQKLNRLFQQIQEEFGEISGRGFVDSAPVLEKTWAQKSGLGWIGKHTNLIRPQAGSWFFLAELMIDLAIEPDPPVRDYCGTCTRCMDACPTDALKPYQINANRCISYLTIELKDKIPEAFETQMDGWAYGCDVCQQVCPWNRFSVAHEEPAFQPLSEILNFHRADWEAQTEPEFKAFSKKSAMSRIKYRKWQENLRFSKL